MQLRTSYFNGTVLRKDLTRFAPLWGLYLAGEIILLLIVGSLNASNEFPLVLQGSISFLPAISMVYAFCTVQLLMGDLFQSRMCNALHALPMRREGWLLTHWVAGILFSLLPNLVFTGISMFLLKDHVQLALWWLGIAELEFLYFFGLALFCAMLVGSRFAHLVVYGLMNALAPLLFALGSVVYEPLLYGIRFTFEPLLPLCPVAKLTMLPLVEVQTHWDGQFYRQAVDAVSLTEGWGVLGVFAAAGLVLTVLTALLYRRRKLERAGDFLAVKALNPVFLVLYTLCAATVLQLVTLFFTGRERMIFLSLGVIIGYFTGRMLLERQVNVFSKKNLLQFLVLALVIAGSLGIVFWDPVGLTRRVPEPEAVAAITLDGGGTFDMREMYRGEEPGEIRDLLEIHQMALQRDSENHGGQPEISFALHYELRDGSRFSRYYHFHAETPVMQRLKPYLSSGEYLLRMDLSELDEKLQSVRAYGPNYSDGNQVPDALIPEFLEALLADCREGNMAQDFGFHDTEDEIANLEICLDRVNPEGVEFTDYRNLTVYKDCIHLKTWLDANRDRLIPDSEW